MSKNNTQEATATATAKPEMKVTPESVSQIATVANVSEADKEAEAMNRARATALEAEANRLAKLERWKALLNASPDITILGQTFKTIQLERIMQNVNSDAGKIKTLIKDKGLGTERINGMGEAVLVPDEKAFQAIGNAGLLGSKAETKVRLDNATALRNLIGSLVHFGLYERQEDI